MHDIIHLQLTQYNEEPKLNKNKETNGLTPGNHLTQRIIQITAKVSF
jgi:hypothetical protein